MCAILDANVVHEVFGSDRPDAGMEFFSWINTGTGILVAGGKVLAELTQNSKFRDWQKEATLAGKIRIVNEEYIQTAAQDEAPCISDDPHVIALARVSGARLLYSNDKDLHKDFKNKALINKPLGKIYTTLRDRNTTKVHRELLRRKTLCRFGE